MWRRACLLLSLGLGLASGLCTQRAHAESPPPLRVSLEYEVDAGLDCPSESDFSARVVHQLGYPVFVEPGAGQRLRIQISRGGERAQARIEWFDRDQNSEGERRLTSGGPGCADLARSLAFAVAVQIQLHASAAAPASTDAAEPAEPAPAPASAPARPEPSAPTPPPRVAPPRRTRWLLGAGVLGRSGFSPGVGFGGRAFGALAFDAASFEVSALATAPSSFRQSDGSGFTAYELGGSIAPCLRLPPLGLCAVGTASLLRVHGEGVDRARSPSSLLASAGGRLQVLWPRLGRLGVLVAGEVVAILTPRDVSLNETNVWTTAPVAFTLSLNFAGIFE